MATEFVRLADVPSVEEIKDSDTVLVVQDGDVKRAPKTAVGGSGGGMLTITFVFNDDLYNPQIIGGSFRDVLKAAENNEPFIMIHIDLTNGTTYTVPNRISVSPEDIQIEGGFCGFMVWYPDGSFAYPD
jgi:hypothetical protein